MPSLLSFRYIERLSITGIRWSLLPCVHRAVFGCQPVGRSADRHLWARPHHRRRARGDAHGGDVLRGLVLDRVTLIGPPGLSRGCARRHRLGTQVAIVPPKERSTTIAKAQGAVCRSAGVGSGTASILRSPASWKRLETRLPHPEPCTELSAARSLDRPRPPGPLRQQHALLCSVSARPRR